MFVVSLPPSLSLCLSSACNSGALWGECLGGPHQTRERVPAGTQGWIVSVFSCWGTLLRYGMTRWDPFCSPDTDLVQPEALWRPEYANYMAEGLVLFIFLPPFTLFVSFGVLRVGDSK